jgi:hypothetical protein
VLEIYDIDKTILMPDKEQDKLSCYMLPIHTINKYMFKKFEHSDNKLVLTARHPNLDKYFRDKWGIKCQIIYRPFCLTDNEILAACNGGQKQFWQNVIEWKVNVINQYATTNDKVVVYDDLMPHLCDLVADNVDVYMPYIL